VSPCCAAAAAPLNDTAVCWRRVSLEVPEGADVTVTGRIVVQSEPKWIQLCFADARSGCDFGAQRSTMASGAR
jgi:hypothetical protein